MSSSNNLNVALSKSEDTVWSETPIDYSMLVSDSIDYEDVSSDSMCDYMTKLNWLKLEQHGKRVTLSDKIFNMMYLHLVQKFKSPTVSYCLIFVTLSNFFDIKFEYMWSMLQRKYKDEIQAELEQHTKRKLTPLGMEQLFKDGLSLGKL